MKNKEPFPPAQFLALLMASDFEAGRPEIVASGMKVNFNFVFDFETF
jgi:hypothetical protein